MLFYDFGRMDPVALLLATVFILLPAALALWQASRTARRDLVRDWAASHFIEVPGEHRTSIQVHLRRLAWARGIGCSVGWIAGSLTPVLFGPVGGVVLGYIASTLLAEVTSPTRLGAGVASLAPRRLEDYVPRPAVSAIRLIAMAVVGIAVLPLFVSHHPMGGDAVPLVAGIAAAIAVAGLLGEATARWVVARRQLAGSAELLAVDDALRSTSAHLLVASVLALELLGLGAVAAGTASAVAPPVLRWAMLFVALAAVISAVVGLQVLAPRPWRVRRSGHSAVA